MQAHTIKIWHSYFWTNVPEKPNEGKPVQQMRVLLLCSSEILSTIYGCSNWQSNLREILAFLTKVETRAPVRCYKNWHSILQHHSPIHTVDVWQLWQLPLPTNYCANLIQLPLWVESPCICAIADTALYHCTVAKFGTALQLIPCCCCYRNYWDLSLLLKRALHYTHLFFEIYELSSP